VDRWQAALSSATTFFSWQQSSTAPTGFTKSLLATSLGANTPSAGQIYALQHKIEGFNTADLAWGTASAKTVTLSFWVRASVTGTYGIIIANSNITRAYPATYTISAANTWEQKTITIAGDTSGTWLTDNSIGIRMMFNLGTGSTNSIASGSGWVTSAGAAWSVSGTTNISATSGATWYVTGVQLEQNTSATPFERRLYGQELVNCQRYYYIHVKGTEKVYALAAYFSSTYVTSYVQFAVTMRANPSLSVTTGTDYYLFYRNGSNDGLTTLGAGGTTPQGCEVYNNTEASGTAGQAGFIQTNNASSLIAFSAEL
jgi:hypothetical protein